MGRTIFYGWLIVGICLVALVITAGLGFYSIGVFFNPLMEEFGWNRTQISAIVTVYWGITALTGPLVGRFLDIHGASRAVIASCFFLQAMGSALFPLLGGLIFDATGSYYLAFLLFISAAVVSGILYLFIPIPSRAQSIRGLQVSPDPKRTFN